MPDDLGKHEVRSRVCALARAVAISADELQLTVRPLIQTAVIARGRGETHTRGQDDVAEIRRRGERFRTTQRFWRAHMSPFDTEFGARRHVRETGRRGNERAVTRGRAEVAGVAGQIVGAQILRLFGGFFGKRRIERTEWLYEREREIARQYPVLLEASAAGEAGALIVRERDIARGPTAGTTDGEHLREV